MRPLEPLPLEYRDEVFVGPVGNRWAFRGKEGRNKGEKMGRGRGHMHSYSDYSIITNEDKVFLIQPTI